jgi:hypothetical protein
MVRKQNMANGACRAWLYAWRRAAWYWYPISWGHALTDESLALYWWSVPWPNTPF